MPSEGARPVIDRVQETDEERLLEALFHAIQNGLIVLDLEFNIILANRWMEQRYSSQMPLRGKKCYAALHGRHDRCLGCGAADSSRQADPNDRSPEFVRHGS